MTHLVENRTEALSQWFPLPAETQAETAAFFADSPVLARHETRPAWLRTTLEKIGKLLDLEYNWDSYGAEPVHVQSVASARGIISFLAEFVGVEAPTVGATPDGEVGFCWDAGDWSLDAYVTTSGRVSYVYLDERDHARDREGRTSNPWELLELLTGW